MLQFPHGRMVNLVKQETITTSPLARCDGHDITLPIYKDQCYNSWKYVPTIISDRDSDLIGVRIPLTQDVWEEMVHHNCRDDLVKFLGNELWERVSKQEFIINPREWWGGWLMNSATILQDFQKLDFHTYVNKEITFVKSNDIMLYARGEHPRADIGSKQ